MPNSKKKSIFIVVPAYNEEKRLASVIKDLQKYHYSIIVIDDASSDKTWSILSNFDIFKLRHKINRGQGATLQTGTHFALKSGAEIIVHFDGDGQFLTSEIEKSIEPILNSNFDIVLGSRFLKENKIPFLKRYFILPVSKIINYFLTGLKLTDAHCGFRAMSRQAAQKINITQDGMSHNTEIVAQIKKLKLKYKEVPITVIYHEFGQPISGGFKILKELFLGKLIK